MKVTVQSRGDSCRGCFLNPGSDKRREYVLLCSPYRASQMLHFLQHTGSKTLPRRRFRLSLLCGLAPNPQDIQGLPVVEDRIVLGDPSPVVPTGRARIQVRKTVSAISFWTGYGTAFGLTPSGLKGELGVLLSREWVHRHHSRAVFTAVPRASVPLLHRTAPSSFAVTTDLRHGGNGGLRGQPPR